jgi:predicted nucleic acid-binding Zn ribbon protein
MRRKEPDPTALGDLLPGILRAMRRGSRGAIERVRAAWPEVVGAAIAARTRVAAVEGGVVRVDVASSAVKQDLAVFRREAVLASLQERLPDLRIRSVSYRLGPIPNVGEGAFLG